MVLLGLLDLRQCHDEGNLDGPFGGLGVNNLSYFFECMAGLSF